MTFYVYILQCFDATFYTGYTSNVIRRLLEHRTGNGACYVKSRLPVELVHVEEFETRSEAMKREIAIKKLSHRQKARIINHKS